MRQPVQANRGLMVAGPSGRVPLGHSDEEENVRPYDERTNRLRLAQRAGLLPLGDTSPCANGSAVTHMFTARRPLPKRVWVELTGTDQDDTLPSRRKDEWSITQDVVVGQGVTSDGVYLQLHGNGRVYEVNTKTGEEKEIFSASSIGGFSLVPCLAIGADDAVFIMYSSRYAAGGGATRALRYQRNEYGIWEETYIAEIQDRVEKFWYYAGDIYAVTVRPDDVVDGQLYTVTRFGGTNTSVWSILWEQFVPEPVSALAFRGGSVYGASLPSTTRDTGSGAASVDWTPRMLSDAETRLYSFLSARREYNVNGVGYGSDLAVWGDARRDPSEYPSPDDSRDRSMIHVSSTGDPDNTGYVTNVTTLEDSGFGAGPEIRMRQTQSTGFDQKAVSFMRSPGALASELQTTRTTDAFATTVLFRVDDSVRLNAPPDNYYVAFKQGPYEIRVTVAGSNIFTITLDIAGDSTVGGQTSIAGNYGDFGAWVCATIVVGQNAGECEFRVNGSTVSNWTRNLSHNGSSRTVIGGGTPSGSLTEEDHAECMEGAYKEVCSILGTGPGRNVVPTSAEIQDVEGYQCHAYGLQGILDSGHAHFLNPPNAPGTPDPGPSFGEDFTSPKGQVWKLEVSTGRPVWTNIGGNGGVSVAVDNDNAVYSVGRGGGSLSTQGTFIKLTDNGQSATLDWEVDLDSLNTGLFLYYSNPTFVLLNGDPVIGWTESNAGVRQSFLSRRAASDGSEVWLDTQASPVLYIDSAGLPVDDSQIGGVTSDQYLLYYVRDLKPPSSQAADFEMTGGTRRMDLIGRQGTGETRDQEFETVAVCESGVVSRLIQEEIDDSGSLPVLSKRTWSTIATDFNPGGRPWSFELFGQHYVGGPDEYRQWNPTLKTFREWTPQPGSVIPERIFTAVRWRGRAIVVSEDSPTILFGSAYGDPKNFATGGDVITATQAFAGTTAEAGAIPDPIRALVPSNDDLLFVGTTSSVWRLTGDPQTGGQLDDVLATEGILDPFSWSRGDSGEMYWATTSLRIVRVTPQGLQDISEPIRPILQKLDPRKTRVELHWDQRGQGLYVLFLRRDNVAEGEVRHLFWCARSGGWHPTTFAGGAARSVRSAHSMEAADPSGWGIAFGFADGQPRIMHPEALDDDGEPIASRVRIPLGGDGDPQRSLVSQAEVVLDPAQGPVRVAGMTARTGESAADYGQETLAQPGRGDRLQIQVAGSHTWIELSGAGQPWAVDDLAVHIHPWGVA